jgi:hypothetical protein
LQQQAPRSQYQPQYFQSGTGSAVNSIPPSRDPKQQQTVVGGGPQAPPSQVGTPTMAIQPHMTSVPGSAAGGAAAQPLPATSVPQPSVAGSVGTAVTASGGVASTAQGQPQQQIQIPGGGASAIQQPTGSVPATQSYSESANQDSIPIRGDELVERLEDISKQQGSPDAAEDSER